MNAIVTSATIAATTTPYVQTTTTTATATTRGVSSLMYACQQGDVEKVRRLLRVQPFIINEKDRTGKTPLHYCTISDNLIAAQAADLLVMAAPELIDSRDDEGFTPLHLAVIAGNIPLVTFLIANNADVSAVDSEKHTVVHWATVCGETVALNAVLAAGAPVSTPDVHGGYPLHYAAQMCGGEKDSALGLQVLHTLLSHSDIDVTVEDGDGRQPLLWAASAGSAKAILALIRTNAVAESADKDGLTALHCAASRGHTDCIDTLLTLCGVSPDVIDSNGCTALHYAVTLGHADSTALLLAHGADPNRQDRKGRSPSHCGCAKGQFETVKMIGTNSGNLWLKNARGDLPLHEAAASGRRDLVKWLLEMRPSQVNARNNDGRCPLHLAALNDNVDMCKILLDAGSQINPILRTSKNAFMTPLDCALQRGFRSTAKFLQLHGGLPASRLTTATSQHGQTVNLQVKDNLILLNDTTDEEELLAQSNMLTPSGVRRRKSKPRRKYSYKNEIKITSERTQYEDEVESDEKSNAEQTQIGEITKSEETEILRPPETDVAAKDRKFVVAESPKQSKIPVRTKEGVGISKPNDIKQKGKDDDASVKIETRKPLDEVSKVTEVDEGDGKTKDDNQAELYSSGDEVSKNLDEQKLVVEASVHAPQYRTPRLADSQGIGQTTEDIQKVIDMSKEEIISFVTAEKEAIKKMIEEAESKLIRTTDKVDNWEKTEAPESNEALANEKPLVGISAVSVQKREEDKEEVSIEAKEEAKAEAGVDRSTTDKVSEQDETKVISDDLKKEGIDTEKSDETETKLKEQLAENITETTHIMAEITKSAAEVTKKLAETTKEHIEETPRNELESLSNEMSDRTNGIVEETKEIIELTRTELEAEQAELDDDFFQKSPREKQKIDEEAKEGEIISPKLMEETETSEATEKLPDQTEIVKNGAKEKLDEQNIEPPPTEEKGKDGIIDSSRKEKKKTKQKPKELKADATPKENGKKIPDSERKRKETDRKAKENGRRTSEVDRRIPDSSRKPSRSKTRSELNNLKAKANEKERGFTVLETSNGKQLKNVQGLSRRRKNIEDTNITDEVRESKRKDTRRTFEKTREKRQEMTELNKQKVQQLDSSLTDTEVTSETESYLKDHKSFTILADENGTHLPSLPNLTVNNYEKERSVSNLSAPPLVVPDYTDSDETGSEEKAEIDEKRLPVRRRLKKRTRTRETKSAGSDYDIIDSGFEPSPRSSRIPKWQHVSDRGVNMTSVTQTIQSNIRRYHLERKIFQHLLELKRLQIRSGQHNESVLVKRAIDAYHRSCAATVGAGKYEPKDFTFKSFEHFLYGALRKLQKSSDLSHLRGLPETSTNPLLCTQSTHRCYHATHAYTGIPCAAYLPKMDHHTIPKIGFECKPAGGFLPNINTKKSVTLELCHGHDKQIISLPTDRLDQNKRYYVTFTVKGDNNDDSSNNSKELTTTKALDHIEGHKHSTSD